MNRKNILLLSISWPFFMCGMDDDDTPNHLEPIKKLSKPTIREEYTARTIVADDPACLAYQEAIKTGNDDKAITLINAGFPINENFEGTDGNALTLACQHGRVRVAQTLFEKGATLNSPFRLDDVVQYPLMVDLLIRKSGSPDAINDRNGETLLRAAILGKHTQTVAILLKRGANPNRAIYVDGFDVSPLTLAEERGNPEIIALLKQKNAKSFKEEHVEWVVDFNRMRFVPVTRFVAACYHNIVNKS